MPEVLRPRVVRLLTVTALCLATAGAGIAAGSTGASAQSRAATAGSAVDWQPCGPGLEAFECATFEVPTDYDRPQGARTTIAVTRLPASDPAHRAGSLFVNPGGPGGSGVDFVQGYATIAYPESVRARYDVVGFDPRGVGRSDPATCFRTQQEEATSPLLTDPIYPVSAPDERRYLRESAELAARCQLTSPSRFAHASTANVARDLDRLRAAVGDARLNYVGYSYGTFLGATYAKLFPQRVGRFVLDGTVDPVAWTGTGTGDAAASTPLGVRVRQGPGAADTFDEFTARCREAGAERCPLAALGDPAVTVPALFDRLLTDPVVLPLDDGTTLTVDQQLLVTETFFSLYYPAQWQPLAEALLALSVLSEPDVARADAARARTDLVAAFRLTSTTIGARLRGEDYPSAGGNLASLCVDAKQSRRVAEYPRLADRADDAAPYFGRFRFWAASPCEFWAISDGDVYRGPWQQTTRAKVLLIGTRHDPATPYWQARPLADTFPHSSLVTVDGSGHTAIPPNVSTCAAAAQEQYLLTGVLPKDGLVCPQDVDPFPAPAAAARTRVAAVPIPPVPAW